MWQILHPVRAKVETLRLTVFHLQRIGPFLLMMRPGLFEIMNIIQNMQAKYVDPKKSEPTNLIVLIRAQIAIFVACLLCNPSVQAKEWTITPSAYAGME